MSPADFATAVLDLQEAGRIKPGHGWKTDLARKCGRRRLWVDSCLARGTDEVTDLAIAALMAGLPPYRPAEAALAAPASMETN